MTRNFISKLFGFSIIVSLISCAPKPNDIFKRILSNSNSNDYTKINLSGAYHAALDEPKAYLRCPIYFFSNGLVFYDFGSSIYDSSEYATWIRKYLDPQYTWGTYEIKGDTINAIIFFSYTNSIVRYLQTYYQGTIKDNITIINWHITEPYPKVKSQVEKQLFSQMLQFTPDLFFKPLSVKTFMDSVADKVWLNKARE